MPPFTATTPFTTRLSADRETLAPLSSNNKKRMRNDEKRQVQKQFKKPCNKTPTRQNVLRKRRRDDEDNGVTELERHTARMRLQPEQTESTNLEIVSIRSQHAPNPTQIVENADAVESLVATNAQIAEMPPIQSSIMFMPGQGIMVPYSHLRQVEVEEIHIPSDWRLLQSSETLSCDGEDNLVEDEDGVLTLITQGAQALLQREELQQSRQSSAMEVEV